MKKVVTLLALLPLCGAAFGQITINASDMPLPVDTGYLERSIVLRPTTPSRGTSMTYNYGTDSAILRTRNYYFVETDTFFTNRGVDRYTLGFKSLSSSYGYDLYNEIDFSGTKIAATGLYTDSLSYDMSSITGGASDMINFPAQGYIVGSGIDLMRFPMTYGNTWTTTTRFAARFYATVSSLSLSNTPVDHVFYITRTDSVIGWGNMTVYTPRGASISYPVLMDKVTQYAMDSFYVSGTAAPSMMLSPFGISQRQRTDSGASFLFYRKGSFGPLARFNFGRDFTCTDLLSAEIAADNITPLSISGIAASSYSVVVFPNPSKGDQLNLMISSKTVSEAQYTIVDITGKVVASGNTVANGSQLQVRLNNTLANGQYILAVTNGSEVIAKETVSVEH
jgi:hypothetical protein